MPFEFKLPELGEGIHEAQLLAWKVSPGQEVSAFQALCEVESAKAAVELTTPVAGRVLETRFQEGDTARLGDVLVVIDNEGTSPTAAADASASPSRAVPVAQSASGGQAAASPAEEWFGIVGSSPMSARAEESKVAGVATTRVQAAPFVRRLARERGVRLEDVHGSGPHGRVRVADLDAYAASQPAIPVERIPLRGLRKSIADHMVEAWRNAPQVTSMDLLDVTELVRARDLLIGPARVLGARLTYLPFFVKAVIEALRVVPEANAIVADDAILLKRDFHIGIATAIEGGLVVPVLRHADRLNLSELAIELERLVVAARERCASPAELSGSTFTITSFGGLPGSPLFATPIVNYPEVAILGLGRIDLQPRVVDGQVVARQCVGVSFTFDHRVLDGEGAGRFMAALKRYIEQPLELLLTLR